MSLNGEFKLKWRILIGQWVEEKLKKFYQKWVDNPKCSKWEEEPGHKKNQVWLSECLILGAFGCLVYKLLGQAGCSGSYQEFTVETMESRGRCACCCFIT